MNSDEVRQVRIDLPNKPPGTALWFFINSDQGIRWHPAWSDVFALVTSLAAGASEIAVANTGELMAETVMPIAVVARFLELLTRIPAEHQSRTSRSAIRRLSAELTPLAVHFFSWPMEPITAA